MNSTPLASKLGRLLKLLAVSNQVMNLNARRTMRIGRVCGLATLFYLALPIAAQAQYTYTTNSPNTNTITITSYTGAGASINIPTNINGMTVTRIGARAFFKNTYLTTVTIPGTVISIGNETFSECTNLTSVAIPNGITNIGKMAFYSCSRLIRATIPNDVISIEDSTFSGCKSLTYVVIGSGVTRIGAKAFQDCDSLTSVTIPNNVNSMGYGAFFDCVGLKSAIIGNGVTSIGDSAFWACSGLTNVVIGSSVTNIGDSAFTFCNMASIAIPISVTRIGAETFGNCDRLTSVTIPDSVTGLGNAAFESCDGLTSFGIGNSVTNIGNNTFSLCSNLKNIMIPPSVKSIGGSAFASCTSLVSVAIGNGVTDIGSQVFYRCINLKSATIPDSVTSLGVLAFWNCSGLTNAVIGSGVTRIEDSTFDDCNSLKSILIGRSVSSIGNGAFSGCNSLIGAYFSGNAPSSVGTDVFSGCINSTVYYLLGATDWPTVPDLWAGRPTALWIGGSLSISPVSTNFTSAAANGKSIGVTANISWTATTNMPWIAVTAGSSGTSNGTVTFSVATNSASSRTGGIVVAGSGISLTCIVVQAGISVPAAPTGVSATDGTYPDQVQVAWSASSGATGYEVWRFTNSNSSLATRIAQGLSGSPYNDTNVTAGLVYFYWLKATNASGASSLSSSNSGFAQFAPPSAPTGVAATKGSYTNKVRVTWSASSGATGYEIWRFTSNNSNSASRIAQGIGGAPYDDTTVMAGTNYYYWLKATNAGGASALSLSDSGYASSALPSAPTGVSASDGTYSDRIRVSWTGSPEATGYEVWRNTNNVSGSSTRIGQNISGSPYDDSNVAQGVTNYYWLKATNSGGASAFSSSDLGLRAFASYGIAGAISYGGSQTGMVRIMASPYFAGQNSQALSLDGIDDGLVIEAPTATLQLSTQMTMCAWINVTGNMSGSYSTILVKFQNDTNRVSYIFALNSKDGKPFGSFGDGKNYYASHGVGVTSGWTHLAFTHDGTVGTWYVNGQLSSATNKASIGRFGNAPLFIGRYSDLQDYFNRFPGQFDDISLWTNALSQSEIGFVMSNTLTGVEAGLAGYWNFDDGTANDLTTNANNGQFMAGATTTGRTATGSSYSTTLASPGGYSITNVLAGEYDIRAYRDSNGNGNTEPWEAYGTYPASPLTVTGNMANINITLQDLTTDSDGDGLSDYDEVYLHGTLWNNPDSDDDGMPDGDEVVAGSNPTNGESMFGFADSQPVPEGGGVVVSWPSLSNRVYRLERTTNLLLDFEPLVNDLPAYPPVNSYTDETPNVLGVYKVGVRME